MKTMSDIRTWLPLPMKISGILSAIGVLLMVLLLLGDASGAIGNPGYRGQYNNVVVPILFDSLFRAAYLSVLLGLLFGVLGTPLLLLRGWGVAPPAVTPSLHPVSRSQAIIAHLVCTILYMFPVFILDNSLSIITGLNRLQIGMIMGVICVGVVVLAGYARYEFKEYVPAERQNVLVSYSGTFASYIGFIVLFFWFAGVFSAM